MGDERAELEPPVEGCCLREVWRVGVPDRLAMVSFRASGEGGSRAGEAVGRRGSDEP